MDDGADFQNANQNPEDIYAETLKAMDAEEGCLVEGTVIINKVPGNFHLSTHAFGQVVYMIYSNGRQLDFSHTINHLSFGNDTQMKQIMSRFGEKFVFDMDGTHVQQQTYIYQGQILANYYLDINQVDFFDKTEPVYKLYEGFKYRASKSILATMSAPAIFFRYELSPIKVKYDISFTQWNQYLIELCAIVGGLFTVAGIVESVLRNGIGLFSMGDSDKNRMQ
ncbi:hypothetical protein FGO68_gene5045 [Halteria grandinella]|uniref:Endoplasmic reticulum vesicle transporter C-terminal domain-containing protein n=1 Tax=Halteria grandinella TaxID=5974 RepID=A0A8J8NC95_HALGN|nr:hypothetical protein FGO68_gene5045 [Halteria grandinella]